MLQCYKCGTPNELGTRFCTACGEKFLYSCPQCNTTIEPGNEYCPACTVKLNWETSPEPKIGNTSGQAELTNVKPQEISKDQSTGRTLPQRRGISPWFVALIITIFLIIAVFVIDKVIVL